MHIASKDGVRVPKLHAAEKRTINKALGLTWELHDLLRDVDAKYAYDALERLALRLGCVDEQGGSPK